MSDPVTKDQCNAQHKNVEEKLDLIIGLITGSIKHPSQPGIFERLRRLETFQKLVIGIVTATPVLAGITWAVKSIFFSS